jgi:hypothetical protein
MISWLTKYLKLTRLSAGGKKENVGRVETPLNNPTEFLRYCVATLKKQIF